MNKLVVEAILDKRIVDHEVEFLVRWKGKGGNCDNWESIRNLSNYQSMIHEFLLGNVKTDISVGINKFKKPQSSKNDENFSISIPKSHFWKPPPVVNSHSTKSVNVHNISGKSGFIIKKIIRMYKNSDEHIVEVEIPGETETRHISASQFRHLCPNEFCKFLADSISIPKK